MLSKIVDALGLGLEMLLMSLSILIPIGILIGLIAALPDNREPQCKASFEDICKNKNLECFNNRLDIEKCQLYWMSR